MIKVPEYLGPEKMKDILLEHQELIDAHDEETLFKKICPQYDSEDIFMNIVFDKDESGIADTAGFTRIMKLHEGNFKYEKPLPDGAILSKLLPLEDIFFDMNDNHKIYYNKLIYTEDKDGNIRRIVEILVYDPEIGFIRPV